MRFDQSLSWGHVLIMVGLVANAVGYYFGDRTDAKAAIAVINAHVEQLKREDGLQRSMTKEFRDEVISEFRLLRQEIEQLRKEIAFTRARP